MRSTYPSHPRTFLGIAIAVTLVAISACGDKSEKQLNGSPAREIQLAPSAAAQPQLNDVPAPKTAEAAPAPKKVAPKPAQTASVAKADPHTVLVKRLNTPDGIAPASEPALPPATIPVGSGAAPAPVAAAAAPSTGVVAAGTTLAVKPLARVCTNTFKVGERFTATLSETVGGSDGAVIPAGSSVVLRVDEATRSENGKDSLRLSFSVVSLRIGQQSYEVQGHVTQTTPLEKVRVQTTGDQAKKVGAGALIGALAGQLLGKNTKSTVIGGAVGAAAGAAVAAGTADYDGCVPANANLSVALDAPLRIRLLPN